MEHAREKSHADLIAALRTGEEIAIAGYRIALTRRTPNRLVIQFLTENGMPSLTDELCEEDELSQMRVVRTDEATSISPELMAFFETLADGLLVDDFSSHTLCAAEDSSHSLVALGNFLPNATHLFVDPPEDLAPVSPGVDRARAANLARTYILYDPFHDPLKGLRQVYDENQATYLKCFGFGASCTPGLRRKKFLKAILPGLLRGELPPDLFYERLRGRKDFPFYRKGIEAALVARGQVERASRFRRAFQNRRSYLTKPELPFEKLVMRAEAERPQKVGAWIRSKPSNPETAWPSGGGNVWMLDVRPDCLRYLSDRWERTTIGFEERDGVTLAQTPPTALGFVGFGGDLHVPRTLARRFRWHVVNEKLDGTGASFGPLSEATLSSERRHESGETLFTNVALSQPQPGITAADADPHAEPYRLLLERVKVACATLKGWEKALVIDRLRLGLLRGDMTISELDAARHYRQTATSLVRDLTQITGQSAEPVIVVTQGGGFKDTGRVEALLSEGRFDLDNPGVKSVVATPSYPWPLMPGTLATPSSVSALMMDELCDLAVQAVQMGKQWFCPSLQIAHLEGREILAEFSSMDGLVLENDAHGFRLDGIAQNLPAIIGAEVISDRHIRLVLEEEPDESELSLAYAWGHVGSEDRENRTANHGALRDRWQADSRAVSGQTLHRYALSGRVPLLRKE
ncbi:hypothetical protein [Roseibium sp. RKSG952]|uniref:hypothetical protein n=1 Tax=Roseibium sp. RKSG952 TaxID=2529384 RepID=UPI0012BC2199|nr:hypothetical protein [Roseibium sp. RKSG952]MTI02785.1 hypothetical protein [Roseibium sp. RKSG952]